IEPRSSGRCRCGPWSTDLDHSLEGRCAYRATPTTTEARTKWRADLQRYCAGRENTGTRLFRRLDCSGAESLRLTHWSGKLLDKRTRRLVTNYYEIPCYQPDRCESEGWMNLTQAAKHMGIHGHTLRLAIQRGEI